MTNDRRLVIPLAELGFDDSELVGGKNASLGELMRGLSAAGVRVPDGFAVTTAAYRRFLAANALESVIEEQLGRLRAGAPLPEVGGAIRSRFRRGAMPEEVSAAIARAYRALAPDEPAGVAVRSSATAEDLPDASFAGQQDTYLNVRGEAEVIDACQRCFASLFTDRAISYREHHGFDQRAVALSVGIQLMVRSDRGAAGVLFTIDPESGFPDVVVIDAAWGLGEAVVGGLVEPDTYLVYKPLLLREDLTPILSVRRGRKHRKVVYGDGDRSTRVVATSAAERAGRVLTDEQVLTLARWAARIEEHYGRPMDIEWALDGTIGELFVVQARPETVQARRDGAQFRQYRLTERSRILVRGLAVGEAVAAGPVCRLDSPAEMDGFPAGAVLVTGITDPDWEPVMKRAAAIVTDHGGRTSHAAIVSRELGVPAVVGTGDATRILAGGTEVTVSCAEGDEGLVFEGLLRYEQETVDLGATGPVPTKVMLNLANPSGAFRWWRLPADGVGLARTEFLIGSQVRIHPLALVHYDRLDDDEARRRIAELTEGYPDRTEYLVERLAGGVAQIAASRFPRPVVVRMSDFKSNEYARLIGGAQFEPSEENPMLGWRGASRYYSDGYRAGFALECRAMVRVRDRIGLRNVIPMIPFCRTLSEADLVLEEMARHGLERGHNGLKIYVMAEVPSNILSAEGFADRFDGFSIGSNDLTQLVLGIDRDSERLAQTFDEADPAVRWAIEHLIEVAHLRGVPVGFCGQRPSDDPEFAVWLGRAGIDYISVTPDSFVRVRRHLATGSG